MTGFRALFASTVRACALLALWIAPAATASGQTLDWARTTQPGPIARIEEGFVSCGGRLVMFGGYDLDFNRMNDLWEYDPTARTWTNRTPSPLPAAWPSRRAGHAMACDPAGERVIVFGGWTDNGNFLNGQFLNDTWEWSTVSKTWTNVTPAGTKPVPRRGGKMVYDAANNRIVLFGGVDATAYFPNPFPGGTQDNKTWVWNLGPRTWTAVTTTSSSGVGRVFPGRTYHGMVYNSVMGRIWIYGGIGQLNAGASAQDLTDIWELNGSVWVDKTPTSGPAPRGRGWAGVAFDPSTNLMFVHSGWNSDGTGDFIDGTGFAETWTFSGSAWQQIVLTGDNGARLPRDSHAIVYDAGINKLVLYGGYISDVIEIGVSAQTAQTAVISTWPPQQDEHSMAFDSDRGRVVLFGGGSPETWELTPSTSTWEWKYVLGPNNRIAHAMTYDSYRRKTILFGGRQRFQGGLCGTSNAPGCTGPNVYGDTWEWDGIANTWTLRTSSGPSPRYDHTLVFDAARNRTILFGGRTEAGTPLNDTWEWDGFNWTNVPTAPGLSARYGHAMAYDPARQAVVLFGGQNASGRLQDTWERSSAPAAPWILAATTGPEARSSAALAPTGSATGLMLLFGGINASSTLLNDGWLWNGSSWTPLPIPTGTVPTPRQGSQIVYDPGTRRVILYGGRDAGGISGELWNATVTPAISPIPVSAAPSSASGGSVTLTTLFRATSAGSMTQMFLAINSTLSSNGGVFLSYFPGSNTLWLLQPNGDYQSGPLGSSGVLNNGVVSIPLAGVSRTTTATDISLTIPMTFSPSFNGPKQIYALVYAGNSAPAGWVQLGSFFVNAGNSVPSGQSITPASGFGLSQTFTVVYQDANGANDIQQAYLLINTTLSLAGSVHLYYIPSTNRLHMLDDNSQLVQPGAVPGTNVVLSNGRFSLNAAQVSVVKSGITLTLTLPITFSQSFAGQKGLYLFAVDTANTHLGTYQQFGVFTVRTPLFVPQDFNHDRAADLGLFRPSTGTWMTRYGSTNFASGADISFGLAGDIPVPGDYDGDGRLDLALYRPAAGTWYILYSSNGQFVHLNWGNSTDVPVPADYTGDGRTEIAVWRPSTGQWLIINLATGAFLNYQWGLSGDVPLTADFDGDGKADITVFRPSNGNWFVYQSTTQTAVVHQWGGNGDIPVPADYSGDGRAELAVYRPSNGNWFVYNLATGAYGNYSWGVAGDVPAPRDADGDGRVDLLVWRPASAQWFVYYLGSNTYQVVTYGTSSDQVIR